ncbi:MAG TPA: CDP-archaeol synthase [Dehalococcoidia bacterium]|nr:CDP-archaeol synthase [Dehalococcoidia bacterium]
MLAQRLATAAIGIPIIIGLILLGGPVYDAVVALILIIASLEFCAMVAAEGGEPRPPWRPFPWQLLAPVGAIALVVLLPEAHDSATGPLAIVVAAALVAVMALRVPVRFSPAQLSVAAAIAYVGFLGAHLVVLRDLDDDGKWVFLPILATWATDTFAYAVGRLIGKTKIAPRISPGKTVEGTVAGLIGGLLSVVVIAEVLGLPMSLGEAVLLGAMLPAAAVLGDLAESHIKRGAGVKDTSELVPGHGGILDRLDSLLFTVPLVYYFAVWVVA